MSFLRRPFRWLLALSGGVIALAGSTPARAGGVLVRLDADQLPEGGVYVELSPAEGETERIQLQDDGQQPDVTAGDGKWAGAAFLPQTEVTVKLILGDDRFEGGQVQWSAPDIPRDLDLTLRDGVLTARAREANPHGGGGADPNAPASTTTGSTAGDTAQGGVWLIAGGAVLFVVLGGFLVGWRGRRVARRGALSGVTLEPSGGFAGPHAPALDDGLVYIEVPEALDSAQVARAFTWSLARHHAVLVISEPPVSGLGRAGRCIYAGSEANPRRVGDALEVVHDLPRQRGVVLFCGIGGTADDWADRDDELPVGAGGIVLAGAGADVPRVGFRVRSVDGSIVEVESVEGGRRFWVGPDAPTLRPSAFSVVDP